MLERLLWAWFLVCALIPVTAIAVSIITHL